MIRNDENGGYCDHGAIGNICWQVGGCSCKHSKTSKPALLNKIATKYNITLEQFEEWAEARSLIGKNIYIADLEEDRISNYVISYVSTFGSTTRCCYIDEDYCEHGFWIDHVGQWLIDKYGNRYYALSKEEAERALKEKRNE